MGPKYPLRGCCSRRAAGHKTCCLLLQVCESSCLFSLPFPFFFFFFSSPESKCQDDSTFFRGIVLLACFDKDWCRARLHPWERVSVRNNEQQSLQSFPTPRTKGRGNPRQLSLSSQDSRSSKKHLILPISCTGNKGRVQGGRTASLTADPL